jgi:hypothetical protein
MARSLPTLSITAPPILSFEIGVIVLSVSLMAGAALFWPGLVVEDD